MSWQGDKMHTQDGGKASKAGVGTKQGDAEGPTHQEPRVAMRSPRPPRLLWGLAPLQVAPSLQL